MYPKLFGTLDSYSVFMFLGILTALIIYRSLSFRFALSDKAFTAHGLFLVASIATGLLSAFLFQAFYNWIDTGKFKFGGITFMGGLVGGFFTFLLLTFFFIKGDEKRALWNTLNLVAIGIAAAHSLGRIGCFMAGCCHGKETDSWIGMDFGDGVRVIPTQLIESIFLAMLCGALLILTLKFKKYSILLIVYLFSYSVFRFILEFYRGDYRGGSGALFPSQWQSIFMFCIAIALTVYIFAYKHIPYNGKQEGRLSGFLFKSQE